MTKFSCFFSVLCAFALFLSFTIGLIFMVALVIGGGLGIVLSSFAYSLMKLSMYTATAAVLVGLIYIYLTNEHELRFDVKGK